MEPARVQETPTTPLAPYRKSKDASGNSVWWTSNDVRDHLALGYDYPQTLAARQSGNYSRALLQWANQQLGWVTANPDVKDPSKASKSDLNHFETQIKQFVASFPNDLSIDGVTPLPFKDLHISSQPSPQISAGADHLVSKAAQVTLGHPILARVLEHAIPKHEATFHERFGDLGHLIKHDKMIQWNITFAVDK